MTTPEFARTMLLLLAHGALQGAFIWGRWRVFRIDGAVPPGVRVIEIAASVSIIAGAGLIGFRASVTWPFDALAWALAMLSCGLFAWSTAHVGTFTLTAAFSNDAPRRLIASGPYRWLRHPFYVAYVLAQLFVLAASASLWAVPMCALMALIYVRAAGHEERKFARSALAAEHAVYVRATGAFWPRWPLRISTIHEHRAELP